VSAKDPTPHRVFLYSSLALTDILLALYDTGGTAICVIKDEIITLHNTMKGEIEGVTLFEVSKHQGCECATKS
jgi:uncharacterized protein YxjI